MLKIITLPFGARPAQIDDLFTPGFNAAGEEIQMIKVPVNYWRQRGEYFTKHNTIGITQDAGRELYSAVKLGWIYVIPNEMSI